MLGLFESISRITRMRDREVMEEALLTELQQFVAFAGPRFLRLYNLFWVRDGYRAVLMAARDCVQNQIIVLDEIDPEAAPLLETNLAWRDSKSLSLPSITVDENGLFVHVFALQVRQRLYALCEIVLLRPVDRDTLQSLSVALQLYENHLAMLDYSEHDTLTDLLNRKTFDVNFAKLFNRADERQDDPMPGGKRRRKPGARCWLAVMDIDHFKRINDQFGHLYGDEVLILVGRLMRQCFRLRDQLYRFGGEEFVVVLDGMDNEYAGEVFDRFRRTVENYPFSQVGQVTISIGFCPIMPLASAAETLGAADDALYRAKSAGRNQVCLYEPYSEYALLPPPEGGGEVEMF